MEEFNQSHPQVLERNHVDLDNMVVGEVVMSLETYDALTNEIEGFASTVAMEVRFGPGNLSKEEAFTRGFRRLKKDAYLMEANTPQAREVKLLSKKLTDQLISLKWDENEARSFALVASSYVLNQANRTGQSVQQLWDVDIVRAVDVANQNNNARTAQETYRQFAGAGAATAPVGTLKQAQSMRDAGRSNEEIRKETGWYFGAEGLPKFEIDDSQAVITAFGEKSFNESKATGEAFLMTLNDLYVHEELFQAYPSLRNLLVRIEPFNGRYDNARGVVDGGPENPVIYLNSTRFKDILDLRSTFIHEIQHVIQFKEQFAWGGAPKYALNLLKQIDPSRDWNMSSMEAYMRMAGEMEARDVQLRSRMSQTERAENPVAVTSETTDMIVKRGETAEGLMDRNLTESLLYNLQESLNRDRSNHYMWLDGLVYSLQDILINAPEHKKESIRNTLIEIDNMKSMSDKKMNPETKIATATGLVNVIMNDLDTTRGDAFYVEAAPGQTDTAPEMMALQRHKRAMAAQPVVQRIIPTPEKIGEFASHVQELSDIRQELKNARGSGESANPIINKITSILNEMAKIETKPKKISKDISARIKNSLKTLNIYKDSNVDTVYSQLSGELIIMEDAVYRAFGVPRTESYLHSGQGNVKAQISINPETGSAVFTLFEGADASSLFHELGHKMLDDFARYADSPTATEGYRNDAIAVFDFVGMTRERYIETRNMLNDGIADDATRQAIQNERRAAHEKFAESFEKYLSSGRAPSPALLDAFKNIRQWLLNIYVANDYAVPGEMTPVMREVFDRLLATPTEINMQTMIADGAIYEAIASEREHEHNSISREDYSRGMQLFDDVDRFDGQVGAYVWALMKREENAETIRLNKEQIVEILNAGGQIRFQSLVESFGAEHAQDIFNRFKGLRDASGKYIPFITKKKGEGTNYKDVAGASNMDLSAFEIFLNTAMTRNEVAKVQPYIKVNDATYAILREHLGEQGVESYLKQRRNYLKRNGLPTTEIDSIREARAAARETPVERRKAPMSQELRNILESHVDANAKKAIKDAYRVGVREERAKTKARAEQAKAIKQQRDAHNAMVKQAKEWLALLVDATKNPKLKVEERQVLKKLIRDTLDRHAGRQVVDRTAEIEAWISSGEVTVSPHELQKLSPEYLKALNSMTYADLFDLMNKAIPLIAEAEYNYNQWIEGIRQRKQDNSEALNAELNTMPDKYTARRPDPGVIARLGRFRDWARVSMTTPTRMFEQFGKAFHDLFVIRPNNLRDAKLRHTQRRTKSVRDYARERGYLFRDFGKLKYKDLNGEMWTISEVMGLYVDMRNVHQREAVIHGNFKEGYGDVPARENLINNLIGQLSTEEMQIADFMVTEMAREFNRINTAMGRELNRMATPQEWYAPMFRVGRNPADAEAINNEVLQMIAGGANYDVVIAKIKSSFIEERLNLKPESQTPIELGLAERWMRGMEQQEHAAHYGALTIDMVGAMLAKTEGGKTNAQVLREKLGDTAWQSVASYMNIITTDRAAHAHDTLNKYTSMMLNNMAVAYLALNLGTVALQFTTFLRILPYAGGMNMIRSVGRMASEGHSFLNNESGTGVIDIMPQIGARTGENLAALYSSQQQHPVVQFGFDILGTVDRWVAATMADAVYQAQMELGKSREEAASIAIDAVNRTQTPLHPMNRPLLWRENGLVKLSMAFMSDAASVFNIAYHDMPQAIKDRNIQRFMMTVTAYAMVAFIEKMMRDGGPRGDWNEPEEWAKWTAGMFARQYFRSVPLVGQDFFAMSRGWFGDGGTPQIGPLSAPFVTFNRAMRIINDPNSSMEDWARATRFVIEFMTITGLSPVGPIPITGLTRPIESLYAITEGNVEGGLARMFLGTSLN